MTTPPTTSERGDRPRQIDHAIALFWIGFALSRLAFSAFGWRAIIVAPSILLTRLAHLIIYALVTYKILLGSWWARIAFTLLCVIDTVDTALSYTIVVEIFGHPYLFSLLCLFDLVYAYAAFIMFAGSADKWFRERRQWQRLARAGG